jgi:hypothetical protein
LHTTCLRMPRPPATPCHDPDDEQSPRLRVMDRPVNPYPFVRALRG